MVMEITRQQTKILDYLGVRGNLVFALMKNETASPWTHCLKDSSEGSHTMLEPAKNLPDRNDGKTQ